MPSNVLFSCKINLQWPDGAFISCLTFEFEYYPRMRLDVAPRMFLYSSKRNARVVINLFISLFKDSAWERNENNLNSLPCSRQNNLCVGFGVITEKATPTCLSRSQCWKLTIVPLTAKREEEEEETAERERERERKREDLAFPDIRGVSVTAIIVLQRLLKGRAAIQTSIKAELSSAQVTGCTWA